MRLDWIVGGKNSEVKFQTVVNNSQNSAYDNFALTFLLNFKVIFVISFTQLSSSERMNADFVPQAKWLVLKFYWLPTNGLGPCFMPFSWRTVEHQEYTYN